MSNFQVIMTALDVRAAVVTSAVGVRADVNRDPSECPVVIPSGLLNLRISDATSTSEMMKTVQPSCGYF